MFSDGVLCVLVISIQHYLSFIGNILCASWQISSGANNHPLHWNLKKSENKTKNGISAASQQPSHTQYGANILQVTDFPLQIIFICVPINFTISARALLTLRSWAMIRNKEPGDYWEPRLFWSSSHPYLYPQVGSVCGSSSPPCHSFMSRGHSSLIHWLS